MIWMLAVLAAQVVPAVIEPTGPWTLSTGDTGCQVVRSYGENPAVQIGFTSNVTSRARILVIAAPKKWLPDGIGETPLTIDTEDAVDVHYGAFVLPDDKMRLLKLFPNDAALRRLGDATSITVGKAAPPIRVTGASAALKAVDSCTVNLLRSWGADPQFYLDDKMAGFAGRVAQWFTPESYPKEARSKHASGSVILLLKTRKDGSVSQCTVTSSADESLNAGTCAIAIAHASFRPPLDASGQPIESYAVLPVRWSAP